METQINHHTHRTKQKYAHAGHEAIQIAFRKACMSMNEKVIMYNMHIRNPLKKSATIIVKNSTIFVHVQY